MVSVSYLVASLEDTWKSFIGDNSDVCVLELHAIRGLSGIYKNNMYVIFSNICK